MLACALRSTPVRRPRSAPRALLRTVTLGVGLVLLGLAPGPSAHAAGGPLTPEDVARLRSARQVAISPDGRTTAYLLSVPRIPFEDDDGTPWTELHVLRPDGSDRPYVTGHENLTGLDWTPDGKEVSFLAKRGEDEATALHAIPLDGGEARRVLSHATSIRGYAWSPDGTRVVFTARDEESPDRKALRKKGFTAEVYEEDWLPVRLWIAALGDEAPPPHPLELDGTPARARWSPDGSRLAVVVTPTPLIDDAYMGKSILIVDAATGAVRSTIHNPGKLGQIAWSPDGSRLAIVSAATLSDHKEGRLLVTDVDADALRDLLPGLEGHVQHLAWAGPETLLALSSEGVWTTLRRVDAAGGPSELLVPPGGPVLLTFDASRDGTRLAFLGQSPRHPTEVFTYAVGGDAPRRATDSNPWLADRRLALQEPVTFAARDGLSLEGILVHPLDEEPGRRYPLILTVHGGPESHTRNGWLTSYASPGQVGAAEGFAVFYPNYRGSTGRGVAFAALAKDDPGGKEFDDLVDAVDHLVATGLADRARVGITGGSYGGYATAWCCTRFSDRFAAGVMFVGISDRISKIGTTDIPQEMHQVHDSHWPWDDWQRFLERSPIYYASQCRTPLLILHGREDPRVNPGQSRELYRHLKVLGKTPVRLVLYPGEGHGNRKAAARYDYSLRMLRWMKHYLQGPAGAMPPPDVVSPPEAGEESPAPSAEPAGARGPAPAGDAAIASRPLGPGRGQEMSIDRLSDRR